MSPKFTLNYGVRLEHETGLPEKNERLHRGVRPHAESRRRARQRRQRSPASGSRRPGVCRRQNGANEYQGDPPAMKFSPRVGLVYSFNPKTVVRAGYGIYWAPWNYQAVGTANYGQIGFSQADVHQPGPVQPTVTLTNPFPDGVLAAAWQHARRAGRRRRPDRVHRSGQDGAAGSAGTRSTSSRELRRQHGGRLRIRRRDRPRPRSRRLERRHHQHQPGAGAAPGRSAPPR